MSENRQQSLLSPPEWLIRGLRPQSAPIPRAAVARASLALATPMAVGFAAGEPVYGALVAMGALSGVIGDTADAYRMRVFNIAVPQCFGAIGVMLGTLVYGDGWTAVAVLTLIALISGMISTIGAVASVSGLLLLLNAVVGAGLPMPGPWWKSPLLLTIGGLFVLALALVGWPWRARAPERAAVAATYRTAAELLAAAGTPAYDVRRQAVTGSLNASYDLILARRAHYHGRSTSMVRLLAQLNVLVPLIEAAAAAHLHGRSSRRPEIAAAVRDLADVVASGRSGAVPDLVLPEPQGPADRAMNAALRHASAVVDHPEPEHSAEDPLGRPAALGVRARRAALTVLLSPASWRYGLRLALCIGLAQSLVSVVSVPRSYWVALTVTFVLKPDFGSVFSRAVLRALGTAAGLVTAALVLGVVPRGWWDVPVMVVLAALIPAFSAKGYAFQTAAITPVILLISDQLNHLGFHLVLPRLLDSLIGCGIALVAGYLLWPESWHTRIGDRLAEAVEESARYVECAFGGAAGDNPADHAARARMRRRLYRDLSVVRTEFQRALTEPPPTGRRAAAWWPLVVAAERIVDATTAARVRVTHGATPPAPDEVGAVTRELRELAQGLRSSATLERVAARIKGDDNGVLAPLRQEVTAAREIASPQR
ncbi:FUSC family protein [Streptomyces sp. NBC_01387]|uniref:FUSC family protein n=1 Tax=unclassified Streptomyces TaxID=2593676 RepID=UPI00202598EC|nr:MULTISPECIES: FUSC family protein [unclassified Streptomyces]MCX4549738.1 FUSC family protein [Streptomyces sp. NBC_01500]WSV55198.1 FUSC family protein [Streptomyces sp. NBC_01014]